MRWSLFAHQRVLAEAHVSALQQFLKSGLEVRELARWLANVGNLGAYKSLDDVPRRLKTRVEIYSAENGLQGIDEQRLLLSAPGLLFSLPQVKVPSKVELLRVAYEVGRADKEAL